MSRTGATRRPAGPGERLPGRSDGRLPRRSGGRLPSRLGAFAGSSRRAVWRRGAARRCLAAALLGGSVYAGTTALAPPPVDPGTAVVIAREDLAVGDPLGAGTVRTAHLPPDLVPSGALTRPDQLSGTVAAAPVRAGEVLTDVRITPAGPLTGLAPDLVLAHLPDVDSGLAAALPPGTRVDVLGTVDGSVLARDALVAQQVPHGGGTGVGHGGAAGTGLLVAVTPEQAGALATAVGDLPGQGFALTIKR